MAVLPKVPSIRHFICFVVQTSERVMGNAVFQVVVQITGPVDMESNDTTLSIVKPLKDFQPGFV